MFYEKSRKLSRVCLKDLVFGFVAGIFQLEEKMKFRHQKAQKIVSRFLRIPAKLLIKLQLKRVSGIAKIQKLKTSLCFDKGVKTV
jgi:hypothetical protein